MTASLPFINNYSQPFLLFDDLPDSYTMHPFAPFALTDALIKEAGRKQQPILHFWQTPPLVVLGMMDTKLPYFKEALPFLEQQGYAYMVRNSGGLAVVGDEGVLNFSVFFPEEEDRLPIDDAYTRMHAIVQAAFLDYTPPILAYEVENSYCPGDFDLSIAGRKIAGISQRRIKGGIAVMIYLSVNGNQRSRAELVRDFYAAGLKNAGSRWSFPSIDPECMTTLEDAFKIPLTISDVKKRLLAVFRQQGIAVTSGSVSSSISRDYKEGMEKMTKRNQRLLP
ncbi:Lipoate-protein ligase A [Alkalibacterium sp. AK22]|uniref:lipoate--protein ligase family protein n=1 Tax=Alkalibacterium sp. AK22 TaxID=1229520 RepID=UPI00044F3AA8|nr:lipoate--protein ligase family protein [Alkalibacterium sp. AK22]EXJ24024.1 Lipoate-protein ligase A [Alkalibacterium sp. AK22]